MGLLRSSFDKEDRRLRVGPRSCRGHAIKERLDRLCLCLPRPSNPSRSRPNSAKSNPPFVLRRCHRALASSHYEHDLCSLMVLETYCILTPGLYVRLKRTSFFIFHCFWGWVGHSTEQLPWWTMTLFWCRTTTLGEKCKSGRDVVGGT